MNPSVKDPWKGARGLFMLVLGYSLLIGCHTKQSQDRASFRPIILGFDGMTWEQAVPLVRMGRMPNFQAVLAHGTAARLRSTYPTLSAPAWTSAVSGVNPGKHGIFGFFRFVTGEKGETRATFMTSRQRQAKAFWEVLPETAPEMRVGLFNIPLTNPAEDVPGYLVSGWPLMRGGNLFSPAGLAQDLVNYQFGLQLPEFDPSAPNHYSGPLSDQFNQERKFSLQLFDRRPTDIFWAVFLLTDRIQHKFWYLYEPREALAETEERYRQFIALAYNHCDQVIGDYVERLTDQDVLWIISDHGFGPVTRRIWASSLIEPYYVPAQRAYAVYYVESGLRLNLRDRDSGGFLNPEEYETVRSDAMAYCRGLRDPETGAALFREVLAREEVYSGPYVDQAPDIILQPADGYYLYDAHERREGVITDALPPGIFSGYHRLNGLLAVAGGPVAEGRVTAANPSLLDLVPNIFYLMNLPIPSYVDGAVISELYSVSWLAQAPPKEHPILKISPGREKATGVGEISPEIAEQLKALNYLR